MQQYITILNRISRTAESRSALTGQPCSLQDLHDQLALRSTCTSKATSNSEIAALKKMASQAYHDGHEIIWPNNVDAQEWMSFASEQDLLNLQKSLSKPYKDIQDEGRKIAEKCAVLAEQNGLSSSKEEILELLSGKESGRPTRKSQKDQRHLDWRDLMSIEMELSGKDPYIAINALKEGNMRGYTEGLLRVFVNVMWFTGIRPTEVWNAALLVPRFDLDYTKSDIDMIEKRPADAVREGLLYPVEMAAKAISEPIGFAANQAVERSRAPAVLLIKSAKQTNAVSEIRMPIRLQILKNIPSQQLSLIAIVSTLRGLQIPKERQDSIRVSMTRILNKIGATHDNLRNMDVNLYAFRHSFATRAKATYEPWEAAALTGHTARNTLYGYGERNKRRKKDDGKSKVKPENWMPLPDPVQAELISSWWSRAAGPGLEIGVRNEEADTPRPSFNL